jgi:enterochelin esterase-like enzyme
MRFKVFIVLVVFHFSIAAQQNYKVEVAVAVDSLSIGQDGRMMLLFSRLSSPEPIRQRYFSKEKLGFARNVQAWDGNRIELNASNTFSSAETTLNNLPEGKWHVQAICNLSDKPGFRAAGNLYSETVEVDITKDQRIELQLTKKIQNRRNTTPQDSESVKFISIESALLTAFWGKPMPLEAAVLLPRDFAKQGKKKYPLRINIGGYGSSWTRASRLEKNQEFMDWWLSEEAPEMIQVFLNGANGPWGDPYYLDSENNGPYGSALVTELIPFIEKEFNGMGEARYRFLDGCSTGGWVSFALQVFYPDFFNGAWSFSADPVDFNHMQLVNMYAEENAFYNRFGYLTPSIRNKIGQPRVSIKDEVAGENMDSFDDTYTTAGGQWGGWNAVYSPKGTDGLPMAAFHPISGKINKEVIRHWEKYDLLKILQNNWKELGPKLQGKLWIWMGDMDEFYLNNAMREMEKFLQSTTQPKSDAQFIFEPQHGHCDAFDHKWVLEMMQEKIQKSR